MRLGRPPSSPDPEKNSSEHNDTPLISRCLAYLFPVRKLVPPSEPAELQEEPQPENQNLFSKQLRGADPTTYAKSESHQQSAKLWSIYLAEAERYDGALVDSWKRDMEGMLIFSGLFSASLTAFLIESYRTLQPDSGDATVQLLTLMSQQIGALSNNTVLTLPEPKPFEPALTSLVCNALWFISLSLSVTCALLATLVEQWAREFLHKTEKRPSPVRRARVFSYLYLGVRRFRMHDVVDLIPMLLHLALILFLAGLVAFLLPINHIMTGIIGGVLAVFVMMYTVLTVLPLVSLDCPYRTPFSGFMWSFIRVLREKANITSASSPPPLANNIHDSMVQLALKKSEARDQRALSWTLQSLTDDNELLPFLEAIPDAIFGQRGFHLVNDHLFIPLVEHLALGSRIAALILSCDNMPFSDPRRWQGLVIGMKAIWALGLISGRTGALFTHSGKLWFNHRTGHGVWGPKGFGRNNNLHPDAVQAWPMSYATAAATAIDYSQMNNLRSFITSLAQRRTADYQELMEGVKLILSNVATIYWPVCPPGLSTAIESLKVEMTSTSEIQKALDSMINKEMWLETNVSIVCRFLLDAAASIYTGGELPYEYMQTCLKIVPVVPLLTDRPMQRSYTFRSELATHFNPSHYNIPVGSLSDLDWVMRCFLRLLPVIRREDWIPIFIGYLTTRNDLQALVFVTQECILPLLIDELMTMLSPDVPDTPLLQALCAILTIPSAMSIMQEWDDQCENLWNYLVEQEITVTTSPPELLALVTMMTIGKYSHLGTLAWRLDQRRLVADSPASMDIELVRNIALHPLMGELNHLLSGNPSGEQLLLKISSSCDEGIIRSLTLFLLACAESVKPPYILETILQIFYVLPADCEKVDPKTMVRFAQSWLTMIRHLDENPGDLELNHIVRQLLLRRNGPSRVFYNATAAPLLRQAFLMYLGIAVRVHRDGEETKSVKGGLDQLESRMTLEGVPLEKTVFTV